MAEWSVERRPRDAGRTGVRTLAAAPAASATRYALAAIPWAWRAHIFDRGFRVARSHLARCNMAPEVGSVRGMAHLFRHAGATPEKPKNRTSWSRVVSCRVVVKPETPDPISSPRG